MYVAGLISRFRILQTARNCQICVTFDGSRKLQNVNDPRRVLHRFFAHLQGETCLQYEYATANESTFQSGGQATFSRSVAWVTLRELLLSRLDLSRCGAELHTENCWKFSADIVPQLCIKVPGFFAALVEIIFQVVAVDDSLCGLL